MSNFETFIENANSEAADIMGEPIQLASGQTVNAIFYEQINPWDLTEHGERSEPTVKLVIPDLALSFTPKKTQRLTRINTSEIFIITEVNMSTGNVELTAQNETKRDG